MQTPKKDDKNWIQKQLSNIARLLGKLAEKFAAALPGIIGSIISWLLNRAKDVVGFMAEHIYLTLAAVLGLIFSYIYNR